MEERWEEEPAQAQDSWEEHWDEVCRCSVLPNVNQSARLLTTVRLFFFAAVSLIFCACCAGGWGGLLLQPIDGGGSVGGSTGGGSDGGVNGDLQEISGCWHSSFQGSSELVHVSTDP